MLKVGVVGAGHLGKIHLRLWKEISDVELIGFFDTDGNKSKNTSESFHCTHLILFRN